MRIRVICDFLGHSGYAQAARETIRCLIKSGHQVGVTFHRHDQNQMSIQTLARDPFWAEHAEGLRQPVSPEITLWCETPEFYNPDPTCLNLGYVQWETSRIPTMTVRDDPSENWVAQMNRMNGIITASQFCASVYVQSGVRVPIYVAPHPIDLDIFRPGEKKPFLEEEDQSGEGSKPEGEEKLTFLFNGAWNKRKNVDGMLIAWSRALGGVEDARLVLKAYGNGSNGEQEAIRDTAREIRDGCNAHLVKNVRFIQGMVPPHQMPDLYRAADVLVHLPYGEGFGLTVQEAAACGIPAIYSNNTSLPEFAEGWPVLCRPEPVHGRQLSRWYQVVQEWWRPDPLAAVAAFLHVYELWKTNPDEIKRTGRNARLRVQKLHNWKVIGGRLGEIFSDVVRRAVTQITQAAAPELTLVPSAPEQKPIGAGEYTFGSDGGGTPPADPGVLEPATRRASTTSLGAGADVPAIGS